MSGHISPKSTYYAVFGALLLGTALTVAAAFVDFPAQMNFPIALAIAITKATLVILFFMHLRFDKIFHSVIFCGAILAASLFVGFTLMDTGQYQQTNIWNPDNPPAAPVGPRPTTG